MKIRRQELLDFYDTWQSQRARHISGITGLIGEPLGVAVLLHKFQRDGFCARLISGTPTTGVGRSPWLDCWITVENSQKKYIYQVEIKSWSAYSIGGQDLPVNADPLSYKRYSIQKWKSVFHGREIKNEGVAKVLIKMRVPNEFQMWEHRALACFWFCLHPEGKPEPHFSQDVDGDFKKLEIFSISSYLRTLNEDINVEMPLVKERIELINSILDFEK